MHGHGHHHHRHGRRGSRWSPWLDELPGFAAIGGGFGDWEDFPFGNFGRGRRGRGRMFASGELRLVLLKLIADQPRHGYELMKAIEELTGGAYSPSPGTVYPTLSLLEDEGAVEESADAESSRKAFAATGQGRDELAEREDEVEALMARLAKLGERGKRENAPQLWRALGNLAAALKNRLRAGGLDSETIAEIVDVIDDAAKRIERI